MYVYVTGPLEASNERAEQKHRQDMDLVCRRILFTRHTPICPSLFTLRWQADPRYPKDIDSWIEQIVAPYMCLCNVFCYITLPIGTRNERVEAEMELWRKIGTGRFIAEHKILEHLLHMAAEEVLQ